MQTPEFDLVTFFERTPDLVCIASKDGYLKKVNSAVIKKLEYSLEELKSRPVSSFIHPDDQEQTNMRRANLVTGDTMINYQNRYLTKSGKLLWLEWSSIYLKDMDVIFAIAKDVTARKVVEQQVDEEYKKFKNLASHFKTTIEADRKYLAAELHEELAQLAIAIKVDVDWIRSTLQETSPALKNRLDHAIAASDLLVNNIRRMSFSISPDMLEDLGLVETLEWHINDFSVLNKINCSFKEDFSESGMTGEMKMDFFRICQDGLDNIQVHSKATQASVTIIEKGENIVLTITDNGIGFNVNEKKNSPGLTEMRERAASINGELNIKSTAGKGTTITVTVKKNGGSKPAKA